MNEAKSDKDANGKALSQGPEKQSERPLGSNPQRGTFPLLGGVIPQPFWGKTEKPVSGAVVGRTERAVRAAGMARVSLFLLADAQSKRSSVFGHRPVLSVCGDAPKKKTNNKQQKNTQLPSERAVFVPGLQLRTLPSMGSFSPDHAQLAGHKDAWKS